MNAHVMNPRTRLSAEQRAKLRKAISSHDGWNDYRRAHGLTMDAMSTEQLFAAADALGVDVAIVAGSEGAKRAPAGTIIRDDSIEGTYRTGQLHEKITPAEISARLGFEPSNEDDPDKVTMIWRFQCVAPDGSLKPCAIWDYKGSRWSIFDPADVLQDMFFDAAARHVDQSIQKPRQEPAPMLDKPTPAATAGDPAHALAGLIAQIAGQSMNPEQVARVVDERIQEALKGIPAVRIECKGFDGELRNVDGHQHPAFKRLLTAASSRMANGYAPNIWLAGPAGSGKTHAGHMLADAMGLAFHLNGAISMPHELLGFIDAAGNYHRTPFREAYEHGGIYMFDEVDGSDNSAILALNAALANGHATFPDMKVKRHPACVIVASANTWGLGATAEYVGRAKIDAAFLSRFPVRIAWEYDTALEVAISGNEAFARRVIAARERARAAGLKVLIDPRASQAGAALIAAGMKPKEAAELTYLANLSKDQRKIVEG